MSIDVVVCAKNRAKMLDSLLPQVTHEIPLRNLIVIYGTSQDQTKETALQYTNKVFWDEDKGLGAARNLGIEKASSEIVAMIDTDIFLPKKWHERLIRHFKNPEVAAAMGTCIYGYGCLPLQRFWEHNSAHWQEQWGCHNILLRRSSILEIGNFNKDARGAGEDYDLYKRLLNAGFKWIWDKKVVVYHPMNLLEYMQHSVWWAKGVSLMRCEKPIGLSNLLVQIAMTIKRGTSYLRIHPLLTVYIPFIDTLWLMIDFKTTRQSICSKQQ